MYLDTATGGGTNGRSTGRKSALALSNRCATMGQLHAITGPGPDSASIRSVAEAISSSPQLAGMTLTKPALRHACASWTAVPGSAASTASVPSTTIGTV